MKLDVYDSGDKGLKHRTPLVFVHGSWCTKAVWQTHFIPFFEGLGYRCIAMDLRGHGGSEGKENLKRYTYSNYAEDVASVVDSIGGNAILIGHSMGGAITERVITMKPVAGAILLAPVPPQGSMPMYNKFKKTYPWKMMKVFFTKNMYEFVKDPVKDREMFFGGDIPESDFKACYSMLQNESFTCAMENRRPIVTGDPNPHKVPILLIGASRDWLFSPEEIAKAGELYGVKPSFYDCGHVLMFENCWKEVASEMDRWICSKGY